MSYLQMSSHVSVSNSTKFSKLRKVFSAGVEDPNTLSTEMTDVFELI